MSEMDANAEGRAEESLDREADDTREPDIETPEADAWEQRASVLAEDRGWPRAVPFDVNEADAADQDRLVELDEDDYR